MKRISLKVFGGLLLLLLSTTFLWKGNVEVYAAGTAKEISFGQRYPVKSMGLYEDRYSVYVTSMVNITEPGRIRITLGHPSSTDSRYTNIILRKNNADLACLTLFPHLGLEEVESGYITLTPGKYEINIYDVGRINDDMYLEVTYEKAGNYNGEIEENDSFDTANEIELNTSYSCDFSKEGDEDYFKFELEEAGKVEVCIENEGYYDVVELYTEDEYGNVREIEINEWNGVDFEDVKLRNIQRLPAGTYYIHVVLSRKADINQCAFSVKHEPEGDGYEKEWNNFSENANTCEKDVWYTGNIANRDDKDWFRLNLDKKSYLNLEFKVPRQIGEKIIKLSVYDQDLKLKYLEIENTNNPYISSKEIILEKGTYYICMEKGAGNSATSYERSTYDYSFCVHHEEVLPFTDVPRGEWYYESVAYVNANGLMTGLTPTLFGPNETLARAQFAVILHRMNDTPDVVYKKTFSDVADNIWYTDGILWASSTGVVNGYSTGAFGPDDNISREQMAVMMYRYANYKKYDTSLKADYNQFRDASKVSSFATEAIRWAVGNGIINGKNNGTLIDPQGNATRGECATIIMRFVELYE